MSFKKIRDELGFEPKRAARDGIEEIRTAYRSGQLTDMDSERYYNLMIMRALAPNYSRYSPASMPRWSQIALKHTFLTSAPVLPVKRKRIVAVVLAYNCKRLIKRAYERIPKHLVDDIIVMDDCSRDLTADAARALGLKVFSNERNLGYGGNLKAGLRKALEGG